MAALDRHTIAAAAVGIALDGHVSRVLDPTILATDGANLVLTMTRAHLRDVIGVDPGRGPAPSPCANWPAEPARLPVN
ncbi:MAG: hypothetical protein H0W46_09225 [Acidimicrobiia bacterium]|nr:hypothetical protein [Acidimicrobiia bacterium]